MIAALLLIPFLGSVSRSVSGPVARPHPASVSRSVVLVEPGRAVVDLRFQTASLLEAMPELDLNRDGRFTEAELEQAKPATGTYLLSHWRLLAPPFQYGDELGGELVALDFPEDLADLDQTFQWVDARLELKGSGALDDLVVHSELFGERDPYHRDFMTFTYGSEAPWEVLFSAGEHRWHFHAAALRASGVRADFFGMTLRAGEWRFVSALFVLACVVAAARLKHVLCSLALLVAGLSLGGVGLLFAGAPPVRFVHMALPLALAYIGAENLLRRGARIPLVEAPLFGALLALTVAASQAEDWSLEPLRFQAGVGVAAAIGALLLVSTLIALVLSRFMPGRRLRTKNDLAGLAARWWFLTVSVCVTLVGLGLFARRVV